MVLKYNTITAYRILKLPFTVSSYTAHKVIITYIKVNN